MPLGVNAAPPTWPQYPALCASVAIGIDIADCPLEAAATPVQARPSSTTMPATIRGLDKAWGVSRDRRRAENRAFDAIVQIATANAGNRIFEIVLAMIPPILECCRETASP